MTGHIPVVQGIAVQGGGYGQQPQPQQQQQYNQQPPPPPQYSASPYGGQTGYVDYGMTTGETNFNGVKGDKQPKKFQDVFWAILFVGHLIVMMVIMTGIAMTKSSNNKNNNDQNAGGGAGSYGGIVWCVCVCSLVAVGLSSITLGFMMQFATVLVKTALIFSVGCSLLVGIMGLLSGNMWMGLLGLISFLLGCCYAYFVWGRIPFAAANLKTGLAAVRANLGLAVVAHIFLVIAFGWSLWWSVTAGAVLSSVGTGVVFVFLLSYYWTHQVIQNSMHVTTAGVVGTWWFVPMEASSCWSQALTDSFVRATTYSFGSICFGSFLVALVQALRALHRMAHENDDCSVLICFIDCILGCIESIIEYLNKWAYVYVGLYGYSYLDAGRNVITLFQNKGWTTIITDDLVDNVLFMVSVAIGLFTGLIGLLIGTVDQSIAANTGIDGKIVGFILGFLIGFLFASILMSVVGSAVNTVIVCFAEAPAEFQANHPELSNEMRMAWRQAWPAECAGM